MAVRILLIEDNEDDAVFIRELLAEAKEVSLDLECASQLSTGLKRLAQGEFDIVLLDLSLPDSQGLDTFDRVNSQAPDVTIVVLSGLDDESVALRAVQKGAQDYLVKGEINSNLLTRAIRYAVERKRTEEQAREEAAINAALLKLETTLGRAQGVQAVCEIAVELVSQLFEGALGYILLWDANNNRLSPAVAPPNLSDALREKFFNPSLPYEQHSIFEEVLNTRQPLILKDAVNDPQVSELAVCDFGICSFMLMPLLAGDELLGAMRICHPEVGELSERNVELAKGATQRIAQAISGERASENVLQQLSRISLLNQITRAIAERQDIESIFRVMLSHLEDHLPTDCGGMCLYDDADDTLLVSAYAPQTQSLIAELGFTEERVIPIEQTHLRKCLQGETLYVPDITALNKPIAQQCASAGLRSALAIPLMVEGKTIALLIVLRRAVDAFSSSEAEFLRKLGEHVALAAHHARLYQDLQQAYDELHQTQQAVMQQERLRALGQMSSGIVHDINNALSPISAYAELILMVEPNLSDQVKRYLGNIRISGEDIANIVARMREFYRQRDEQEILLPVNLNRLITQVIELTKPRWRDIPQQQGIAIEIETDLHADLPFVMGIESEIREALTNLIFNAVDALPKGGVITIRTRILGTNIGLEVSDTGVGMDDETQKRCLEPFYSTKGERGTGLGLSMVYGIMQRHQGKIDIESVLGKGTTLQLIFPLHEFEDADRGIHAEEEVEQVQPLHILVIDDEPRLRELMRDMLTSDGHAVELADGGQAGLDAFRKSKERGEMFDVVITDLGMPDVSGHEVIRTVKRESPETPVILLTGWGNRLHPEEGIPKEADVVLSKPPKINEVRKALSQFRGSQSEHPA